MPALLYGFGFPIRQAAGTGLLVLLVTSATATYAHARQGHVHLGAAMVLAIGASVSAQLGALATARLPARWLRSGLFLLIAVTVLAILYDLLRQFG